MCRDADERWVAVEIKRVAGIEAVEQLTRYLERIRLRSRVRLLPRRARGAGDQAAGAGAGAGRGIDCVEVDLAVLRGEREPELKLFAA